MKKTKEISEKIQHLPNKPGVYQYFDEKGVLIYVGKAKSLKKRVSSYFTKQRYESGKTRMLVNKIRDIKHIVVESEHDAFLLENTLIKKHQPKYNIQLRDDKTYPWLCVKKERFPRVFSTRNIVSDGSKYYGPFASVKTMKTLLRLISRTYKLRTCSYNLSEENIKSNKFKVCLEYHIGNCKAPCIGKQTEEDYNIAIEQITNIVKGNLIEVIANLKKEMHECVSKLDFEQAQQIKDRLELLENYQSKSTVVSPTIKDVEVFAIDVNEKSGFVNYMKVNNGVVVQGITIELKKKLDESREKLLIHAITELRQRFQSKTKEIIVPFDLDFEIENAYFFVPQRGDKRKLLQLSERNVKSFMLERQKNQEKANPNLRAERILNQLKKDLRLTETPWHIECFDNSNFQGTNPVAACVVFKNGKPSKKDYRHFNIKTVEGPNDFASMEEVVYRRYKRLQEEKKGLPQLIIIDGGKGQLGSALKSLEKLGLRGKIGIVGIAKKLEEIYFPGDSLPLYIDKKSESLKLIQHLRNEAHRFGITFHRQKRSKAAIKTELDNIKGIGPKTRETLLKKFKSTKRIKEAKMEQLLEVIQKSKAEKVWSYFNTKQDS